MNITIFDEIKQIEQYKKEAETLSLYQAFESVKDGRKSKGKRYPLAFIFTVLFLGKMAGETTLDGIIDWVNERKYQIKKLLYWPKDFPVRKTYIDALAKCDHHEVAKVLTQVILKAKAVQQCGEEPSRLIAEKEPNEKNLIHTAVDGKILRGTLQHDREDQPPVHLLSFYECESGLLLDQFLVKKENNEESACRAILSALLVKNRLISVDAIFSCKEWCALVHRYNGYYQISIKGNTPVVLQDLEDFFAGEGIDRSEFQYYKEVNKGHGRLEVREIWSSTQMNEWFEKDWAGTAQVFMIRKSVKEKGEEAIKVSYGITNLPRAYADAKELLEFKRKHWYVENHLHYRLDVTLREDYSQVRTKGVPEVFAALNRGLLALMDHMSVKNVAKQMRHFCAHPDKAILWLFGDLSKQNEYTH